MAAIDTIYNYYLSTYGSNTSNRYDTHKKSELRSVYNQMVKVNKESPLYKIVGAESGDVSRYAIDIKEASMQLKKVAFSLSDDNDSKKGAFKKKVASSSNPDKIDVTYVGKGDIEDSDRSFTMEVKNLAKPQINRGQFLNPDSSDIDPGQYSFDLENTNNAYEFQYSVGKNETNDSVQKKLVKLINGANVGVKASLKVDDNGFQAIELTSKETGKTDSEEFLFKISPTSGPDVREAMKQLGFDRLTQEAENSTFVLNGVEHNSLQNTFTINNEFEITLKDVTSENEETTIGFENDINAIYENVNKLVAAYNAALQSAEKYADSQNAGGAKLLHDISAVGASMKSQLESMGLQVQANGVIMIDKEQLSDAIKNDATEAIFSQLNSFKNAASSRASKISINPLEYVNKVVVAYKNPGNTFNTPYSTSMYAGLMLDQYA